MGYLQDNCFFQNGNKILTQVIWIPVESDSALFFGNYLFYYYESKWIKIIQKTDIIKTRRFVNIFKFIDELTVLNDVGELEGSFTTICPPELELQKENDITAKGFLLDLGIKIRYNMSL